VVGTDFAWNTIISTSPAVTARPFGTLPDGRPVDLYSVTSDGIELHAMNYGGIITSLRVPDRYGASGEVILGFSSLEPYLRNQPYFGAIVGRYANRIASGRFVLDGVEHQLALNDGPNHLHGGLRGFDQQHWSAAPVTTNEGAGVRFTRTSPDGEEHYPGELTCHVTYLLTSPATVELRYEAVTDAPTIVNLTQHSYFNLGGEASPSVLDHELTIHASYYTPVERTLIPSGPVASVDGTPFDFRRPVSLRSVVGATHDQLTIAGGFDHNFILHRPVAGVVPAATLHDPRSGRLLQISTTEPGLQFYGGHLLDGTITGAYGRVFSRYAGLCLETQHYPDSPHRPDFPSVELRPSNRYRSITRWQFGTD
jgi:aldose 1-epimerase